MPRLSRVVRDHLEKAREAALAAVGQYNRPGVSFRTRTYAILMVVAWTALFHAIFYRRGVKPWYVLSGKGRGVRYDKVDGDPKHWDLSKCLKEFFRGQHPPERKNLEFLISLRNKIEHRDFPELDPALYGECQACLMNFEDLVLSEFGAGAALSGYLSVALQFSALRPSEQQKALGRLQSSTARDILDFIERFRADLPPEILESSKFSLKVFLVPKLANRKSAADLAVEFIPYDPSRPEEMKSLQKVTALIKEKQVPVAFADLLRPAEVVERLQDCVPHHVSMHTHTLAWKHYKVRPASSSPHPERTKSQYCVYDALMGAYGYKEAWVRFLCEELSDPEKYKAVTGWLS